MSTYIFLTGETVALIIGGYSNGSVSDSVELFGCGEHSIFLPSLPSSVYLSYGLDMGDSVLLCGGYGCQDDYCSMSNVCYWLDSDGWHYHSTMNQQVYAHFLDINNDGNVRRFGYRYESDTYNDNTGNWTNAADMETRTFSIDCGVQYQGSFYFVMNSVEKINLETGESEVVVEEVPSEYYKRGKCALTQIDGQDGILNDLGYFMDLNTFQWSNYSQAYYLNDDENPLNNLWSYQGKPTVFGPFSNCQDGCVYSNDVIQFDPQTKVWNHIGNFNQGRSFHAMVEVSSSFCDMFG